MFVNMGSSGQRSDSDEMLAVSFLAMLRPAPLPVNVVAVFFDNSEIRSTCEWKTALPV